MSPETQPGRRLRLWPSRTPVRTASRQGPTAGAIATEVGLFLAVGALFLLGALADRHYPGIYMDGVNPDYIVVRLLQAGPEKIPVWIPPGNLLFGKFPVLGQIYHGTLSYYLGLPVYLLLGTSVEGIRAANAGFGLLVMAGAWTFLRAFGATPIMTALALGALALDPSFVFSFRTQFYITLLPVGLLLAGMALTWRGREAPSPGRFALAGCLAGLSVFGYFIYAFLLPAALGVAVAAGRRRVQPILAWCVGVAVGMAPYALGYALVVRGTGGFGGFARFLAESQAALSPDASRLGLLGRGLHFLDCLSGAVTNVGNTAMMVQATIPSVAGPLRPALLLAVPLAGVLVALWSRRPAPGLAVCAGLLAGLLALTLTFGDRLWQHHFAAAPVIAYVALGLGLAGLQAAWGRRGALLAGLVVVPLLMAVNLVDRQSVLQALRTTGGIGFFSSAITEFAEDSRALGRPTTALLPDWGVFMPFAMITRGDIPFRLEADADLARQRLCAGQDVLLALLVTPRAERVAAFSARLGWGDAAIREYRQKDGTPLLLAARWAGAAPGDPRCPSAGP